jgi:RHS repeat-associated protein
VPVNRITRIEVTQSGSTSTLEHYTYTDEGQLKTWWHGHDWVRNDYTYDGGGRLVKTTRRFTSAPAGSNTAAEDAALATCRTNWSACDATYGPTIAQVMYNALPEFGDPTQLTGVKAAIARSMARGDEWLVKSIGYNAKGQVTSLKLPYYVVNTTAFGYDNRGNMTNFAGVPATYHQDDTLKSSPYHGFGYEITDQPRTVDGRTSGRAVQLTGTNQNNNVIMDQDDQGRVIWVNVTRNNTTYSWMIDHDPWGINSMELMNNGDIGFQYYDHRGTQLAVHVPSGPYPRVTKTLGYDPYGEPNLLNDGHADMGDWQINDINPYRWGGRDQTWDDDYRGGLFHTVTMGVRQYSPVLHSFLQPDPMPGQTGAPDAAYGYVGYDPVNQTDPSGQFAIPGLNVAKYCGSRKRLIYCLPQYEAMKKADAELNSVYPDRSHATMAEGGEAYHHLMWMGWGLRADYDFRDHQLFIDPNKKLAIRFLRGLGKAHEKDGQAGDKQACLNSFKDAEAARCVANAMNDSKKDAKNNEVAFANHRYLGSDDISDDAIRNLSRRLIYNRQAWVRWWNRNVPFSVVSKVKHTDECYLPDRKDNPCVWF